MSGDIKQIKSACQQIERFQRVLDTFLIYLVRPKPSFQDLDSLPSPCLLRGLHRHPIKVTSSLPPYNGASLERKVEVMSSIRLFLLLETVNPLLCTASLHTSDTTI